MHGGEAFDIDGSGIRGSVARYNVCVDNSQASDLVLQGDIYLTWSRRALGDVQVYDNAVVRTGGYSARVVTSTPGAGSGFWDHPFAFGAAPDPACGP